MPNPQESESSGRMSRLLVAAALDPDVYRGLQDAPEETFALFALSEDEKELLRQPDHRLLRYLGSAIAQSGPDRQESAPVPPPPVAAAHTLPDLSLVLTVQPCAQYEEGRLLGFSYAAWVNPYSAGSDPASFGPPPGSVLPGEPLTPLHALLRISAMHLRDDCGNPQVGLTASLLQGSNMRASPPAASARVAEVRAAADAVRGAPAGERYGKLIELLRVLRPGEAQ